MNVKDLVDWSISGGLVKDSQILASYIKIKYTHVYKHIYTH